MEGLVSVIQHSNFHTLGHDNRPDHPVYTLRGRLEENTPNQVGGQLGVRWGLGRVFESPFQVDSLETAQNLGFGRNQSQKRIQLPRKRGFERGGEDVEKPSHASVGCQLGVCMPGSEAPAGTLTLTSSWHVH